VLLILFLLITAPLSTQAIAQAAHRRARRDQPAPLEEDKEGATR
jgi:multisubunit Na+/H+ antiporter MnhG subunit